MQPGSVSETPHLTMISAGGVDLAVWDWPGADPPLLFAHATGFHGRCWDQVVRRLAGRRRVAVDFRGHGRSSKPDPPYLWRNFGRDLAAVADQLGLRNAIGIGHSMGGHSVVQAAALRPDAISTLLLIDPTIFPPEQYGREPADVSFILRRRATFHSPAEMLERFRARPPFAQWQPDVLRDYCEFGVLPEGGEFVLACPPAVEHSIYSNSRSSDSDIYPEIQSVAQSTLVMRSGAVRPSGVFDLSASPTAPDLASKFPRGRDIVLGERSHYIPMEAPELVAAVLREMT